MLNELHGIEIESELKELCQILILKLDTKTSGRTFAKDMHPSASVLGHCFSTSPTNYTGHMINYVATPVLVNFSGLPLQQLSRTTEGRSRVKYIIDHIPSDMEYNTISLCAPICNKSLLNHYTGED